MARATYTTPKPTAPVAKEHGTTSIPMRIIYNPEAAAGQLEFKLAARAVGEALAGTHGILKTYQGMIAGNVSQLTPRSTGFITGTLNVLDALLDKGIARTTDNQELQPLLEATPSMRRLMLLQVSEQRTFHVLCALMFHVDLHRKFLTVKREGGNATTGSPTPQTVRLDGPIRVEITSVPTTTSVQTVHRDQADEITKTVTTTMQQV